MFTTIDLPGYPGFKLAVDGYFPTRQYILDTKPDGIYVASSDGPLGFYTGLIAAYGAVTPEKQPLPYVSSFTTRLDQFIAGQLTDTIQQLAGQIPLFAHSLIKSIEISPAIFQNIVKSIYSGADKVMVPSQTMINELLEIGFERDRLVLWPRGIDKERFHLPVEGEENPYFEFDWYRDDPKSIAIFFGRISLEKNIEVLLDSDLDDFHKVIIGKGPHLEQLQAQYQDKNIHFLGPKYGEELSSLVRHADVNAFTSLTDTFGNTILEAGASGVPTIGFDGVPGPQDIIKKGVNGYVINDQSLFPEAVRLALQIDRESCALDITTRYSWDLAAEQLVAHMKPTPFYQEK
jgi:glycosyltransferase involved in cell wall biosynthesis